MMEYLSLAGMFFVAILGMLAHFAKKKIKGESITEIKDFFKDNAKSTLLAFVATFVGFVFLVQTGEVSFVSAFGVGYMFDSAFNKWDKGNGE